MLTGLPRRFFTGTEKSSRNDGAKGNSELSDFH
jgi:hypothetical protein